MKSLVTPDLSGKRAIVFGKDSCIGAKISKSLPVTVTVVTDTMAPSVISDNAVSKCGIYSGQMSDQLNAGDKNSLILIDMLFPELNKGIQQKPALGKLVKCLKTIAVNLKKGIWLEWAFKQVKTPNQISTNPYLCCNTISGFHPAEVIIFLELLPAIIIGKSYSDVFQYRQVLVYNQILHP